MNRIFLSVILCLLASTAIAHINETDDKLPDSAKKIVPFDEKSSEAAQYSCYVTPTGKFCKPNKPTIPEKPTKPAGPRKKHTPMIIRKSNDRIYMPSQYSCYMRQTRKFCQNRHGKGINGRIVSTYDDRVAYETYFDGYQSGTTTVFNQQGILLQRIEYKKGVRDGEAVSYYANGNVEVIAHYKDGALNGRLEQYDINGALVGRMTYKKGWFREGYCKNEASDHSMEERLHADYNEVIPCGTAYEE